MLSMIGYVLIVGFFLSLAALIAEHAARQRQMAKRWVWLIAMVASLLLPLVIPNVSVKVPNLIQQESRQAPLVLREATSVHLPLASLDQSMDWANIAPGRFGSLFHEAWLAASAIVLATLILSGGLLYRRKRTWKHEGFCGISVLVAPDAGPAVVGLLHPQIVIPTWLFQESAERQRFVLAHEQSHLDAADPQLLTFALCLLVAMPWNLPMWWQFHRLRRAIEMDCDARVLSRDPGIAGYCETLIEVGQHKSRSIGAVAAMSESGSFLEQRIRTMLRKPGKWARASALAMIGASVCVAAFAAQVTPPEAAAVSTPKEVSVAPSVLTKYVGTYRFGPYAVMTVKLDGSQLSSQLTGQPFFPIYPSSNVDFFVKVVDAHLTFVVNAQGQSTAMEFYQNGRHRTAPRIDAAEAKSIQQALDSRVAAQKAYPDSENDLRIVLSQNPDAPGLSPDLATLIRQQKASADAYLAKLGPATSHEFIGVTPQGWDKYLVHHQNGTEEVGFVLAGDGTILSAFRRP